ncbi:MAG: ABC transporter substrate-binding protein [Desulforegulaceae bacterium]|nr:ABC transporter substrate-binding protein [Desulforegulaceae bacterium]
MFYKHLKPFIFILISLFILCSCEKKEILIGFSGELTGINSDLGIHGRNGAALAIEEINNSGGINGKKLSLLVKDDEGKPEKAKQTDKELIKEGVTAIIGHMTSSQTMAALPEIEKSDVILLSPTTSTPLLSEKKDKFFRIQGSSEFSACALGSFASQNFDIKNFLILKTEDNKNFTEPYQKNFLKCFAKNNTPITHKTIPLEIEQVKDFLINIYSKKDYQGILIITSARRTTVIAQVLYQMEKKPLLFISSWGATEALVRHGGKSVENAYLAKTGFTEKTRKDYKNFLEKYIARFGKVPSFSAEQGYLSVKILALALEKTKGKKQGLENAITNIKNYNSFQGNLTIDEFGDTILPVSIVQVKNGKLDKILEIEPKRNFLK